ncbi:MAG: diguanylate cyclase [Dehalococcoidales bacterium]|nr:MAG: diguanylate cyclase [Dehalococcoidales bacterium]
MNAGKIAEVALDINNLYGLNEQAEAFVSLITDLLECRNAYLLLLDSTGENLGIDSNRSVTRNNGLADMSVLTQNPAIDQLVRIGKAIIRDDPVAEPVMKELLASINKDLDPEEIEIILPLISGDRLMGILLLEGRESGTYTSKEIRLLNDFADRIAPGMEREFLRGQLSEREKELSALNRCGSIISSSPYIGDVYQSFIEALKEILEIEWASLTLIEEQSLCFFALYSEIGSNWKVGDRIPLKGTATEWVSISKLPVVESDLKKGCLFVTDVYHRKQGIRSIACTPLIVLDENAIGSLIVGVSKPNAYNSRQLVFLRELGAQISGPIQNSLMFEKVLKKSRYDELTGLFNRRTMDEQMITEVSRHSRYGGVFSLILIDLDSMKQINDQYGHLIGDGLLSSTGKILKESIRSADQAFRYGGDEFAILLPNTSASGAVIVAERVREILETKLIIDDMNITASIGLASWPANGSEAHDIVAAADTALYRAKNEGGNRSFYDKALI